MKQYKNKIRQEICDGMGKINAGVELKILKSVMDLLINLNVPREMECSGTAEERSRENFAKYNIIRAVVSGSYSEKEMSLIYSFLCGIETGKKKRATS